MGPTLSLGAVLVVTLLTWTWGLSLSYEDVSGETRGSLGELRQVAANTPLEVGAGFQGRWILAEGFEAPEVDGAWISSLRAKLIFEVVSDQPPIRADLTLVPLLAPALPTRTVTISGTADRQITELRGGGQTISVVLDGSPSQELVIDCASVDSPLDLGVGSDKRQLCAKVTQLFVTTESS